MITNKLFPYFVDKLAVNIQPIPNTTPQSQHSYARRTFQRMLWLMFPARCDNCSDARKALRHANLHLAVQQLAFSRLRTNSLFDHPQIDQTI